MAKLPDPNQRALGWALRWTRTHLSGFGISTLMWGVIIAVVAEVFPLPVHHSWDQRVWNLVATFGVAVGALWVVALPAAVILAPYGQRNQLRRAVKSVAGSSSAIEPVPIEVSKLDDSQYPEYVFFRLRARNIGTRKARFRARVAELIGTDTVTGAEAPFELPWRHGNVKWAVEISPDDDEVFLDIGRMPKYAPDALHKIEVERWGLAIFFSVLAREGEEPMEVAAPIVGVKSVADLRHCNAYARIIIRHVESGVVVANKMVRFYYDEIDGLLVPQMLLYDASGDAT